MNFFILRPIVGVFYSGLLYIPAAKANDMFANLYFISWLINIVGKEFCGD
jgi:hypothetical protein